MKTILISTLAVLISGFTTLALAQVQSYSAVSFAKPLTVKTASSLLNNDVTYQVVSPEKSSLSLNSPIAELIRGYDKKVSISYQIASVNALEWISVRRRAADILDSSDYGELASRGLIDPLQILAWDDYVPISAYAPLNIKLNFKYASKKLPYYYSPEGFADINNSPSIHTKTLQIKK